MSVKVSSKFQIAIPKPVRTALGLHAGSRVDVIAKGRIAYLVPVPTLAGLQKTLAGKLDGKGLRDKKHRAT